jgi:hypothetical protein
MPKRAAHSAAILSLILLLGAIAAYVAYRTLRPSPQAPRAITNVLNNLNQKTLELDLVFEDEDGNPVDGVGVTVDSVKVARGGWGTQHAEKIYNFDKQGHVACEGAGITLYISKSGYLKASVSFSMDGTSEGTEQLTRLTIPSITPGTPRLRIVMEKGSPPTILERRAADLNFRLDGSGDQFSFTLAKNQMSLSVKDLNDKVQLLSHGFFVTCLVGNDGMFEIVKQYPTDKAGYYPAKLILHAVDPNDGFVKVIVPPLNDRPYQHAMRKAPEDGYVNTIEFTGKEMLEAFTKTASTCAFYLKCDGKYGRGAVGIPQVSADRKSLKARVAFSLQPDGTTNLETGE